MVVLKDRNANRGTLGLLSDEHPLHGRFHVRLGQAAYQPWAMSHVLSILTDGIDQLTTQFGPDDHDTIAARRTLATARQALQ